MEELLRIAKELTIARDSVNDLTEKLAIEKEKRDNIQQHFINGMEKLGLRSFKTDSHSFSKVVKNDVKIISENEVMNWLNGSPEYEFYVHPKLDTLAFKGYAKNLLKESGEIIDGTELVSTEYISIKATNPKA